MRLPSRRARGERRKRCTSQRAARISRDPTTAATTDRDFVQIGEKVQQAEEQAADESADQAQPQIAQCAKAPAFPLDYQPGEAAAEETNDYSDDELIE